MRTTDAERAELRAYIERWSIPIPEGDGCHLWLRSFSSSGYGAGWITGHGREDAHRISHIAFVGDLEAGELVRHSCHNRWCVNGNHVSRGDHAANMLDDVIDNRRGVKLTAELVREIRRRHEDGDSSRGLSAAFGVRPQMIHRIVTRTAWRFA